MGTRVPGGSVFTNSLRLTAVVITTLALGGCVEVAHEIGLAACEPVYGNWCGQNYPEAGNDPDTVDDWDAACRDHDQCYDDSSRDKSDCDREFRHALLDLSHSEMVPQELINAYDWFQSDGHFQAYQSFQSTTWALGASCSGGDGRAAVFSCQTPYGRCDLDSDQVGQANGPCGCYGWGPGQVVEDYE
jgi:hypothetical protein